MSKFQKRHYEAIAKVLAECKEQASLDETPEVIVDWIVEEFRAIFVADNSNFNSKKFIVACENKE